MKQLNTKYKFGLGTISAFVLGVGGTFAVFAAIPSAQGVINGCRSDLNGQLRVVDSTATCGSNQSSLQWDRGLLAYGHILNDAVNIDLPEEQAFNMTLVPSLTQSDDAACISVEQSAKSKIRFASLAVSSYASTTNNALSVLIDGKSQTETDTIDAYCPSSTDVLVLGTASAYLSIY